jgi:hypothetical protein
MFVPALVLAQPGRILASAAAVLPAGTALAA